MRINYFHRHPLRNRKHLVFFIAAIFFSCNSSEQKETAIVAKEKKDSVRRSSEKANAQSDFISVLKGINSSTINQFIHPEKGLWLTQQAGAVPQMTNTSQVDKNFPVDFSEVKEEEIAKVNCDFKTFWTKGGCFAQKVNTFLEEKIWIYASLSKEDQDKIEALAKTISYTVVNTSLNARYYFSQLNGKWYLLFADLRKPCEA
ncbi:MAG TPA: hypothetical protein VII99_17265 [Bacteroidia bacterium]